MRYIIIAWAVLWAGLTISSPPLFFAQNAPTGMSSPDQLGFTHYWLADDISGTNGDPVGTWPDGIASNDATAAGSARPTLLTADVNGHSSVEFDGVNDVSALSSSVTITESTGATIVIVAYIPTSTSIVCGLTSTDASARPYQIARYNDGNVYFASDQRYISGADSTTGWQYYVGTIESGSVVLRRGGSVVSTATTVSAASTHVDQIGKIASQFGVGKIAFTGIRTGAIDPAFVAAFEAWAASYYGLP